MKAEPHKSAVVLARTKAEARVLSWLMRERVLGDRTDIKRAVIEVSRDLDGRVTEPLEIAVGDRLRIGATQWEKQLFNGTVVTVEDLEVKHEEGAAVTRKARNRLAGGRAGRDSESYKGDPEASRDESPVHITARTDDGRRVSFRHDEIRDYHDNIRIDYGYAMTIASAQGLTVDRAFLLIDDRPSRETVYPAATRHREGIDVYVNRSPIVFDIAESLPEDEEERPVLDSEVRAYLAERWSRSQPKEAALDYIADGMWRDAREGARVDIEKGRSRPPSAGSEGPGERQQAVPAEGRATAETPVAVNDNAIVRIAQEIRHAVNGWRHGAAVDAFAAERAQVMAAWDELRQRSAHRGRRGGAEPRLPRDPRPPRRADEAGRVLPPPSAGVRASARRARRYRPGRNRGVPQTARARRQVSAVRDGQGRPPGAAGRRAPGREAPRRTARDEAQIVEAHISRGRRGRRRSCRARYRRDPAAPDFGCGCARPEREPPPDWRTLYRELQRDWNDLVARSQEPDLPLLLMDGYDALIHRVRALADHPGLSERARGVIDELLAYHDDETVARETAEGYLAAAERHVEAYKVLEAQAGEHGLPVVRLDVWPRWREAAQMLAATGKAVLANEDRYGAYLDAMTIGKARAELAVEQLRDRLRENRAVAAKREARQTRREPTLKQEQGFAHRLDEPRKPRTQRGQKGEEEQQGFAHTLDRPPAKPLDPSESRKGFAHILDDPEKLRELREKAEQRDRKLGRHMRRSRGLSM